VYSGCKGTDFRAFEGNWGASRSPLRLHPRKFGSTPQRHPGRAVRCSRLVPAAAIAAAGASSGRLLARMAAGQVLHRAAAPIPRADASYNDRNIWPLTGSARGIEAETPQATKECGVAADSPTLPLLGRDAPKHPSFISRSSRAVPFGVPPGIPSVCPSICCAQHSRSQPLVKKLNGSGREHPDKSIWLCGHRPEQ